MIALMISLIAAPCLLRQEDAPAIAIRGARIVTVSRGDIASGSVLVSEGRIRTVGRNIDVPQGAELLELPSTAVVVPGFIDLHSHLGSLFEMDEATETVTPQMRALDAFSSTHPDVASALASGVTLVVVSPGSANLVGGRAAILRINGRRLDRMILAERGPLKLSLGDEALRREREPTSRTGAISLLRSLLRDGTSEVGRSLIQARESCLVHASRAQDILKLLELSREFALKAVVVHAEEAHLAIEELRNSGLTLVFGPLTISDGAERLATPGKLSRAGMKICFATDAPAISESQLRLSAAMAVRRGMDPQAAIAGLTLHAAEVLGLSARLGSIEEGKEADLVIYSGDPLSAASIVEMVIVEGRIVHRRPKK